MKLSFVKAVSITKIASLLHLTVSSSIIIFGIGAPPIWQGLVGIIAALEGYFGITQQDHRRVVIFILGLAINAIVGGVLGMIAKTEQAIQECNQLSQATATRKEQTFTLTLDGFVSDCTFSYQMYAYVEIGTAILSTLSFFVVLSAYLFAMKPNVRQSDGETFILK
mmetsp:Transcript_12874/g.20834  ORF Transcript_12874/g.20834 Transcript_12874/m.20834 type:complete len:166 (-) Transcript_12874:627-1124(-)